MPDPSRIERILLVRLSAVGDVINTLPAVAAVRKAFPRAFIGFVVEDRARDLIVDHPHIDETYVFERKKWSRMARAPLGFARACREFFAYIGAIRRRNYQVLLDFQGNLKSLVHDVLSSVPVRIGFSAGNCMEWNHVFTNVHVHPPTERMNRVEKFLTLVTALGVHPDGAAYTVPRSEASAAVVRAFLSSNDLRESEYLVIHPGTSEFGKEKRWPVERFAELARRLCDERRLRAVVTWGPGEREMAARVAQLSAGAAVRALETRSILDLAEVIRRARLFIGCDSGPLHLASAVETPSVALFGPKDPAVYGPYNRRRRIVYKGIGNGSMNAITVDDAVIAVEDLLGEKS